MMPSCQYIRVKRRRNASSAVMLQLEVNKQRGLADLSLLEEEEPRKKHMWKRVDVKDNDDDSNNKRSFQVIDAVLTEDTVQQNDESSRKRRRLLVIPSWKEDKEQAPTATRVADNTRGLNRYKVLNPVERLVDDSLIKVTSGSLTAAEHYIMCRSDPNLSSRTDFWLEWCNDEVGNLLHACSLWNDVETATELLSRTLSQNSVQTLLDSVDGQGRTPYEVAEMAGNTQICNVLEAFGGDRRRSVLTDASFVYDYYCLDDNPEGSWKDAVICDLAGKFRLSEQTGELLVQEEDEPDDFKGDEDSNDENWEGNDYPDEDCGLIGYHDREIDSDDEEYDSDGPDQSFRHRRAKFEYDDDYYEYAHDAAYGVFGQDSEFDSEV